MARAEAFRQEQDFSHAEPEYKLALEENPNDLAAQLQYADTLYSLRRFPQAIAALDRAETLASTNPAIYALRAQIYATQANRQLALRDIQLAEQYGRIRSTF